MKRRQLLALFVSSTSVYFIGNTLLPLLPVYVRQFGVEPTITGIYLGLAFAALAVGSIVAGWLSNWLQTRKWLIVMAGIISLPALVLMAYAPNIELLTLLTVLVWFSGGITTTSVNILTGMYADKAKRGRTFGIIGMTLAAGAVLAGLTAGPVVKQWGYGALFLLAAASQIAPIIGGLLLEDRREAAAVRSASAKKALGSAFWLLFGASVLAYVVHFSAGLGRPLAMDRIGLDAAAISSTAAVSGLITLPLPVLIGGLSDRLGRRYLLALCYAAVGLGALLLVFAESLWHFWLSTALFSFIGTTVGLGSALVLDSVPPAASGAALARFMATPWLGGVIGYASAGFVIQQLGFQSAFLAEAALPMLSVFLILTITQTVKRHITATSTAA